MGLLKKVFKAILRPFRWFKRTRRRNKFITIILLLVATSIIGGQIQQATAKPPYQVEKAKYDNVVQIVSETGNVNTGGRVDIYSTATGIIEEAYVSNGTQVALGDNLFKVRSTATEQEKASAYAAYQSALSSQKAAEQGKLSADSLMWTAQKLRLDAKENKRLKDAYPDKYEDLERQSVDAAAAQTEKDFTAAETKYKQADVAVNAAKAQVTATWLAYQATQNAVIKATTDGSIANFSLEVGDNVTAGTSGLSASAATSQSSLTGLGTTSTPVLTIANLSSDYSIKLALNEVDIPKIKQGQPATIKLDAISEKTFTGAVTHVDAVGTNAQGIITYNILVSITNPDVNIKPGMTADVDIEVDKATRVLTVPNNAVKPYKGGRAVRIVNQQTKQLDYLPVEIGLKGETRTEIIKGIKEGQEVVTALSNDQVQRSGSGGFF